MDESNSYNSQQTTSSLRSQDHVRSFRGITPPLTKEEQDEVLSNGNDLSRHESNVFLSRNLSRIMTGSEKLLREASLSKEPLPLMGENRDYPPMLPDRACYAVTFNGLDDPSHPHNFPLSKKLVIAFAAVFSALTFTFGSAMFSAGSEEIMKIFHIGITPAALGTSLYVFGFGVGPVFYGPLSELFGRRNVMIISEIFFVSFSFATAVSKDIQSIMICRFFCGLMGSAPFVVTPAIISDVFSAKSRGTGIVMFGVSLFGGPMIAPIIGGFTVKNPSLSWRWTSYICGIIGSLALVIDLFALQETHHPVILIKKAETLRRRTGIWGIYAPHEELTLDLKEICVNNLARPLKLLFTEPIILSLSIYNAFIYAMLYMFLTAVPLIFSTRYKWSTGVADLPYISMMIGLWIGGFILVMFEKRYNRIMDSNSGKPIPEERLPPVMIGSFIFVLGIFWMGWTGDYPSHVHWIVPTIGAAFVGNGLILIFLPTMNYIIDCYLPVAASALAGNTFLRSSMAAAFPLFSHQLFVNLSIKWASTLIGCLAVLMIPIPFLFYKYGKSTRDKSQFALKL